MTSIKPCIAAGCRVVTKRDVDGDRRADVTTITPARLKGHRGAYYLRTVTARNQVSQVLVTALVPGQSLGSRPWAGSAYFDGQPGVELLMASGTDGYNQTYRMYTWRQGRLVESRTPGSTERGWYFPFALRWATRIDSDVRNGVREAAVTGWEQTGTNVWHGTVRVYQWRKGKWVHTLTRPVGGINGVTAKRPPEGFFVNGSTGFR